MVRVNDSTSLKCTRCGESFTCGAVKSHCWCMDLPIVENIPKVYGTCLCKNCLQFFAQEEGKSRKDLEEGKHFYLENGFTVFTEEYHLNRGYCCNSGCRHCPYSETETV